MKYVPAPTLAAIRILNLFEVPMFNGVELDPDSPDAGKQKPWLMTYQEYLLNRTADEVFLEAGGKKEGLDALELMHLARRQIKATKGVVGFHAFEEEVAKRLRAAILKPKTNRGFVINQELDHNFLEWALCWKNEPKNEPPAVLQLAEAAPAATTPTEAPAS